MNIIKWYIISKKIGIGLIKTYEPQCTVLLIQDKSICVIMIYFEDYLQCYKYCQSNSIQSVIFTVSVPTWEGLSYFIFQMNWRSRYFNL